MGRRASLTRSDAVPGLFGRQTVATRLARPDGGFSTGCVCSARYRRDALEIEIKKAAPILTQSTPPDPNTDIRIPTKFILPDDPAPSMRVAILTALLDFVRQVFQLFEVFFVGKARLVRFPFRVEDRVTLSGDPLHFRAADRPLAR